MRRHGAGLQVQPGQLESIQTAPARLTTTTRFCGFRPCAYARCAARPFISTQKSKPGLAAVLQVLQQDLRSKGRQCLADATELSVAEVLGQGGDCRVCVLNVCVYRRVCALHACR
jgi:hypothetical protein